MNENLSALQDLPPLALAAIILLIAVQVGLQVFALVDLARRKQVVTGHKVLWVLVILLGLAGAIAYLAFGRLKAPPAEDPLRHGAQDEDRARRAVDVLYGKRDSP